MLDRFLQLNFFIITLSLSVFTSSENWHRSTGNNESHRYASDDQITPSNIQDLTQSFFFNTGEKYEGLTIQSTPIFIGDKLIINGFRNISAVHPSDGSLIWHLKTEAFGMQRGITFNKVTSRIYRPTNNGILEIDSLSGELIYTFENINSSQAPIIYGNNLLVATLKEGVVSFNLDTKQKNWQTSFEMNGYKARVWSGFSFDSKSGLVFVVTGSSGGSTGWWRNEPNLETSVIALDAISGKIVWTFQHIEHDIWDLDLVGNPMILDIELNGEIVRSVAALSKTGDILLLNVLNGEPIHEGSYQNIKVPSSEIPREKTAAYQKKFFKPEPFWTSVIDMDQDFSHLKGENKEYVANKLRFAKSGFFVPPSFDYDLIIYGIHGGPEWMGGAIDFSSSNPSLIVPYNRDPWIIRAYNTDKIGRVFDKVAEKIITFREMNSSLEEVKPAWVPWDHSDEVRDLSDKIYSKMPFSPNTKTYTAECSSCHGIARRGWHEFEGEGDLIYPPLVGTTLTKKKDFVMDYQKVKSLHKYHNIPYSINAEEHQNIFNSFDKYDRRLLKFNLLSSQAFWQVVIDKDRYPATKPPWGGLAKIDLVTGKEVWNIPLGNRKNNQNEIVAIGDKNFGGVLTTSPGIIFATGNPNADAYAFDTNGNQIWESALPFAGSAPPMTYTYNNCQYVVFVASGGRFLEFGENGDAVVAYKLNSCS